MPFLKNKKKKDVKPITHCIYCHVKLVNGKCPPCGHSPLGCTCVK